MCSVKPMTLALVLLISLAFSACSVAPTPTPSPIPAPTLAPRAIRVDNPITPPDVPMVNQAGQPAKLSDFRGKPALIFFGNIRCEESCVDALPVYQQVKRSLRSRSSEVNFVMVGTDRTADSPEALKRYLLQFDPSFIGLTAERDDMRQLAVRFGIHTFVREDGALAPHAPFIYLLDRQGRLLYFVQDGLAAPEIAKVVEQVLNE